MEQWLERWKVDLRFRVQIPLLPFLHFFLPQMRVFGKCGRRSFFGPKKLRLFLKNNYRYINYRYDRRFSGFTPSAFSANELEFRFVGIGHA